MTRKATFLTSNMGWIHDKLGAGHSALACEWGPFPFYITWSGRRPNNMGTSANLQNRCQYGFGRLEANRRLGFEEVRGLTGAAEDNTYAWNGFQALTENADFGRLADKRIDIPVRAPHGHATTADENLFGIDVDLIAMWWINILKLPHDSPLRGYKMLATMNSNATNCNGMVARALQIGMLDAYATAPKNLFYQGNSTLTRWVIEANKKIETLNKGRSKVMLQKDYRDAQVFPWGDQQIDFDYECDLPPLKDWIRHSAVKASLMTGIARRKEQILEIDRLLPLYHTARQNYKSLQPISGTPITMNIDDANAEWMKILISIYEQCFNHLVYKPTSDRRHAVLSLTKNIYRILEGRSRYITKLMNGEVPPIAA